MILALTAVLSVSCGLVEVYFSDSNLVTFAESSNISISNGQYFRMGAYEGIDVDWVCAFTNGTGTMMLSKYVLKASAFGANATYKTSYIHGWLDIDSGGTFATDLGLTKDELKLARTLSLQYGDGTDKFIIPSYEELKGKAFTKVGTINSPDSIVSIYWLRTPRDSSNARVVRSGDTTVVARYSGSTYGGRYIRPMFYLDTNELKSMIVGGSGTESDPYLLETRYDVNTNISSGGTISSVKANRDDMDIYIGNMTNRLVPNAEVTFTVTPNTGYLIKSVNVNDGAVDLTDNQDGTYSFIMPEEDVTLNVEFEIMKFNVNWLNEDGTVLETDENVEYGTIPTYDGEHIIKESDVQYCYTFIGWSPEVAPLESDMTYTAQFVYNEPTYTVIIPADVNLSNDSATANVTADYAIGAEKLSVTVSSANNYHLKAKYNSSLLIPYTISCDSQILSDSNNQVLSVTEIGTANKVLSFSVDPNDMYAGAYSDNLTFTISLN